MAGRQPFNLRKILIGYNFFQTIFSAWIFYEVSEIRGKVRSCLLRDRLLEIDGSLGEIRISSRQPQRKRETRSMAMLSISVSLGIITLYY